MTTEKATARTVRDSMHEDMRSAFRWGSFGINGDEPQKVRFLKDLSPDHIYNIVRTQHQLDMATRMMFVRELVYRLENKCLI